MNTLIIVEESYVHVRLVTLYSNYALTVPTIRLSRVHIYLNQSAVVIDFGSTSLYKRDHTDLITIKDLRLLIKI